MILFLKTIMPSLVKIIGMLIGAGTWLGLVKNVIGEPGVAIAKVADGASSGVQNSISSATGGLIPPAPVKPSAINQNAVQALPTQSNGVGVIAEKLTNPWLYVALGGLFLFATTLTKQTRGLARDVGSGVSTARGAVKDDFADIQSDPGNHEFRRSKRA